MKKLAILIFILAHICALFSEQVFQFYGTKVFITVPDHYVISGLPSVSISDESSGIMITYQMSDESVVEAIKSNKFLFMWQKKVGEHKVYYKTFSEEDFKIYLMAEGDEEKSILITGFIEGKDNFRKSHKKMLSILSTIRFDEASNENFEKACFFSEFDLDGLEPIKIENRNIYFSTNGDPIETADIVYKLAIEKNYRYSLKDLRTKGNPTDHLIEFGKSISTEWIGDNLMNYESHSFMTIGDNNRIEIVSFCIVDGYIYTVGGVYRNTDEVTALKDYTKRIKTFKTMSVNEVTQKMIGISKE